MYKGRGGEKGVKGKMANEIWPTMRHFAIFAEVSYSLSLSSSL